VIIPSYGHAGDGNLHSTPIKPPEMSMEKWYEILPSILETCMSVRPNLGGSISGEHGMGQNAKDFMKLVMQPEVIDV
jgi:glycolate oxidase